MEIHDFVSKFHNLPGRTLPEKQKNINLLIGDAPLDHDALLAALAPKTRFEHLLKVKLLLKLHRIPELVQILKHEEEYLPAKLLKNKWFCQKLASILDENSSDFVAGVLPFTSYVIRKRLIAKLAKFGNNQDLVYDEIRARYGVHTARDLLVGCSKAKIDEVLKSQKVVLSRYGQKLLYQKHPQVFALYAKQGDVDESVLSYVGSHDSNYFLQIIEKKFNIASLGKRSCRKLLKSHKETLIAKAETFSCVLHLKTVRKVLTEDEFAKFFLNCGPPNIENLRFWGHIGFNRLRQILGKEYYKFLSVLVKKRYKKSIYDFNDLVTFEMMESMDVKEREKWVSIKRKHGASENDLVAYMKISDSVPLLKNKINVTSSVNTRENLVIHLIDTCKINQDYKALEEVGEYFCARHRNDDCSILRNFVYRIHVRFPLEKLSDKVWKSVNTILAIMERKGDESFFKYDVCAKYVEFLFAQKKLTDKEIHNLFKQFQRFDCKPKSEELRKLLLLKAIEMMPTLFEEAEKVEDNDLGLIVSIFKWNKDHPDDKLSFENFPRLVESLKKATTNAVMTSYYHPEYHVLAKILKYIICVDEESQLRTETINNYFSVTFPYYNLQIDEWLLKHQPDIIYANAESFSKHLFEDYRRRLNLWNYIKTYTDASFLDKVVTFCMSGLEENDHRFEKLAALVPPDKFLQYVAPFYPSEDKIDDEDEDARKRGLISCKIAGSFKFSTAPVLPELIKYCRGDFKNNALESLYYLFYHSPENQLSVFLDDLSSKSVSVRKHAIFLTCIVSSVHDVKKLLKRFIQREKNVSVQKHMFTAALKYFIKNPSDDFWESVKICMTRLNRNDSESFGMVTNLHQIPAEYQARHVIFVWDFLNKIEDVDKNCPRLLSSIPASLFKDFPLEFLLEIISSNFLKSGSNCESAINTFVVSSLLKTQFGQQVMNAVFDKITQVKNTKYESLSEEKIARDLLFCFVSSLTDEFASGEESYETLTVFAKRWHSLFSATEAMREHLKLSFVQFYLESKKDLAKFSTVVAEFLENFVSTYGVVIVDAFALELKSSLQTFLACRTKSNEDFLTFVLTLVKNWNSLVFYLLVIKLLPSKQPSDDKAAELFLEIIQILRQVPQVSIQMLLNLYIMDMECND